jgi:hypothetical protein
MRVRKILDTQHLNFVPAPQGSTIHHLPETKRGLVESCARKGVKLWCAICKSTRRIESCGAVLAERMESVTYQVRLAECGHDREFSQSIARTPSGKKKLQEEKARAAKAKQKLSEDTGEPACALDSDEVETEEIRATMRESGVLTESVEETEDEPAELGLPLIRVWDRGAS